MIGRIKGILVEKQAPSLLVDVGGIGYELQAPMTTFYQLPAIGREVVLFTHLAVREDAHTLYGFAAQRERMLFRELIKIRGIGARLALTILSGIEPDSFVAVIANNDVDCLIKIPGVGKKTAERLLIEMRDRLKNWEFSGETIAANIESNNAASDAISAMIALGYKPQEAQKAIAKYRDKNVSSEELIRRALKDINS